MNDTNKSLVSRFISQGIHNEYLFSRTFFEVDYVCESVEDLVDVFYRRLVEDTFVDSRVRKDVTIRHKKLGGTHVQNGQVANVGPVGHYVDFISVSDVIRFIDNVMPPILKIRFPNVLRDIDEMESVLKIMLSDDESGQLEYNLSVFKKVIGMNRLETSWIPDAKKLNMIQQHHPNDPIIACVDFCTIPIGKLIFSNPKSALAQMTFRCNDMSNYNLNRLWYLITVILKLHVCDLYVDDVSLCVMTYMNTGLDDADSKYVFEFLQKMYKPLVMKKK